MFRQVAVSALALLAGCQHDPNQDPVVAAVVGANYGGVLAPGDAGTDWLVRQPWRTACSPEKVKPLGSRKLILFRCGPDSIVRVILTQHCSSLDVGLFGNPISNCDGPWGLLQVEEEVGSNWRPLMLSESPVVDGGA